MATKKVDEDPPEPSELQDFFRGLLLGLLICSPLVAIIYKTTRDTDNVKEYQITSVVSTNNTTNPWNILLQYNSGPNRMTAPSYTFFQVLLFHKNNNNNSSELIAESIDLGSPDSMTSSEPIMLYNKNNIEIIKKTVPFEIVVWFKYKMLIDTNTRYFALESSKSELEFRFCCTNLTVVFNNITGSGLTALGLPKKC